MAACDLGVGGDVDLGDDGRVRRVDDRAAGPVRGGDPLTVDVQAGHGREDGVTLEPDVKDPSRASLRGGPWPAPNVERPRALCGRRPRPVE